MIKCIGIIGGLGPKTAFQFAQHLNDRVTIVTKRQPDILLENLPVSDDLMKRMTKGEECQEIVDLMLKSVRKFTNAGVDIIIIPCNTVHAFIEPLRKDSTKPILSIIEETARACKEKKLKTIGILASNTTIKQKLYAHELSKLAIKTIIPSKEDQNNINDIIFRINRNKANTPDKITLVKIAEKLHEQDAEAVILACTDLQQLVSSKDTVIPLLDSFAILEAAAFNFLIEK